MRNKQSGNIVNATGFTLIELLIVVSIISILAGAVISVLNIGYQRRRAGDSVDLTKLGQLSQAIEAFNASEGYYPPAVSGVPVDPDLDKYLNRWPDNFVYVLNGDATDFDVYFPAQDAVYYKYSSSWAKISPCGEVDINVVGACN